MAETRRGDCSVCGREGAVTADGGLRHHFTEDPEQQAGPDSRKCRGVGLPPAGSVSLPGTGTGYVCRIPPGPEGCGRPVTLTSNGRSRSHLNNRNTACAGGSDWPLLVGKGGVRTDTAPDPHRQEAEAAMAEAGRIQDALDAGYEQSVQDGLTELRGLSEAKAVLAGDKSPATHTGNPSSHPSPYVPVLERAVGDPGTVLDRLETDPRDATVTRPVETIGGRRVPETECAHDFSDTADDVDEDGQDRVVSVCRFCGRIAPEDLEDPRDEDPTVECACNLTWASSGAMRAAGHDDMDCDGAPMVPPASPDAAEADDLVFDATHRITDESGIEWVHPGEAADCRLPECCTHPRGFTYGDDGKGHSGSVCTLCGAPEPEPCTHPYGYSLSGPDGDDLTEEAARSTVRICMDCGAEEPDWRTPADLLARMPVHVQELAATRPECWDCGHEVTPLVERFEQSGNVRHVVWGCRVHCAHGDGHIGQPCRPRRPEEARLGDLDEGDHFIRHQAKAPLDRLVYRAGTPVTGPRSATVVSAGLHHGRTGTLTNLQEEITCTDVNGQPRPRRTTSPTSSPVPPLPGPTGTTATVPGSTRPFPVSAPGAGTPSTPATASGPTEPAATSARTAAMSDAPVNAVADFLGGAAGSRGENEAEYGRWGRYKLRHPSTGKTVEWTRATTFAKSISDTYTLSQWGNRCVVLGAAKRPDLVEKAQGREITRDREFLNDLAEEMKEAAGAKVAADWGTKVHSWTELCDRNWDDRWAILRDQVPDQFKPHVESYLRLLEEHGLVPVASLIEFSTAVLQYEVMGTSDNCYLATRHLDVKLPRKVVRLSPGEFVIGDKKTGKDLSYGWQEICIQLSLYAQGLNTLGRFDWPTKTWDPKPLDAYAEPGTRVREDIGVVLHLPVDPTSDKLPAVHGVDLESGWNAVVLCERVRTWRKLKNLAGPIAVAQVTDGPTGDAGVDAARKVTVPKVTVRPPTLRERAEAVTSRAEASAVYKDATAQKVSLIELDELVKVMQAAVAAVNEPGGAKT